MPADHLTPAEQGVPVGPGVHLARLEAAVLALLAGTPISVAAAHPGLPVTQLLNAADRYQAAGRAALTSIRSENAAGHPWCQVVIEFAGTSATEPSGRAAAERTIATVLAPSLRHAERSGLLRSWWFVRKTPQWRLRFHTTHAQRDQLREVVITAVEQLRAHQDISWSTGIYEPEIHAFGGAAAMDAAHHFFHRDSAHVLTYLEPSSHHPDSATERLGRRELSMLLCAALLRAAGQDWHEQGDVWARVAAMRPLNRTAVGHAEMLDTGQMTSAVAKVRRLLLLDPHHTTEPDGGPGLLAPCRSWFASTTQIGSTLHHLAQRGVLTRGLRAVLAHHVIFHWNRLGLPTATQASLAHAAAAAILTPVSGRKLSGDVA